MSKFFFLLILIGILIDFFNRLFIYLPASEPAKASVELASPEKSVKVVLDEEKLTGLFGEYKEKEQNPKTNEVAKDSEVKSQNNAVDLNNAKVRILMIAVSNSDTVNLSLETKIGNQKPKVLKNVKLGQKIMGFDVVKITPTSVLFQKGKQKILATIFKPNKKEIS